MPYYNSSLELWVANEWGASFQSREVNGATRRGWFRQGTNRQVEQWIGPLLNHGLKVDIVRIDHQSVLICPTEADLKAGIENTRLVAKWEKLMDRDKYYASHYHGLRYVILSKKLSPKDSYEFHDYFQSVATQINQEAQEDRYIVRSFCEGSRNPYSESIQAPRYMICPVTMYPQGGKDDNE